MKYDFRSFLCSVSKVGEELNARCPFHDDSRPSFSANVETGLWICHAGCGKGNYAQFLSRLGGDPQSCVRYSRDPKSKRYVRDEVFRTVAAYEYMDTSGTYHLRVTRQEKASGDKRFFQEHMGPDGRWVKGGAVNELLPYLMHLWSNSDSILFFVEGEKCAEFLNSKGLNATTVPGGANKWMPSYAKYFKGKRVVILPDNDEAGLKFARHVHISLHLQKAGSVTILQLPGLGPSEDVVDWLSQNRTVNDLLELTSYI